MKTGNTAIVELLKSKGVTATSKSEIDSEPWVRQVVSECGVGGRSRSVFRRPTNTTATFFLVLENMG